MTRLKNQVKYKCLFERDQKIFLRDITNSTTINIEIIFEKGSGFIMYKIKGHYIYLTNSQYRDIVNKVTSNETTEWQMMSCTEGFPENIEKHKRIKNYIENHFKQEYYKFDFYGENARDNVIEILSSYDELTDTIKIFRADNIIPDDAIMETITGYKVKKVKIKIYENNFLSWLFGKKDTGSSITIRIDDVTRIHGELTNFIVENKKFYIRFRIDDVNLTYK